MSRFSKQQRQKIVREFAIRHNGQFNPRLFFEEVRRTGEAHPAYPWFEWNLDKAAFEHHLWQAREFARDLRVVFTVEEIGARPAMRVRQEEVPLVISPLQGRRDGGGYHLFDQGDPEHMAEHCRQAAQSLATWIARYSSAVSYAGGSRQAFEDQQALLAKAAGGMLEAAAA